jgi:hypothetical protein
MTFPPQQKSLIEDSSQQVSDIIYFGIDCRDERERTLGLFPRAYCIDTLGLMSDTDKISKLLSTLEPLASSLHLCIIGAGEDFFRATYQQQKQGKLQELDSLQSVIADDRARLNAVAMFFLKRSFPHVSILDGGFISAVRHLRKQEPTLSLSTALADVNVGLLEAVLSYDGKGVVSLGPTTERALPLSLAARLQHLKVSTKHIEPLEILTEINNNAILKP